MTTYVRYIAVVTIFSLVAFLGGLVKFGGAASIALDSWASFFVAAFFGPIYGGSVGLIAHILSAATGGFQLGPAVHAVVAIMQFLWAVIYGLIARKTNTVSGLLLASLVVLVCNGVFAPYLIGFVFAPLLPIMKGLIPVLLMASAFNVALAGVVLIFMRRVRTQP